MALAPTPYKITVTGSSVDANGVTIATVQVKDTNGVVLQTVSVAYNPDLSIAEQLRRVVEKKYIADGGVNAAVLAIAAGVSVG